MSACRAGCRSPVTSVTGHRSPVTQVCECLFFVTRKFDGHLATIPTTGLGPGRDLNRRLVDRKGTSAKPVSNFAGSGSIRHEFRDSAPDDPLDERRWGRLLLLLLMVPLEL